MRPIFSKLAWENRNNQDAFFAEINADKNETEEININRFPTIVYVSPSGKHYEVYEGDYTVAMMSQFLADKIKSWN